MPIVSREATGSHTQIGNPRPLPVESSRSNHREKPASGGSASKPMSPKGGAKPVGRGIKANEDPEKTSSLEAERDRAFDRFQKAVSEGDGKDSIKTALDGLVSQDRITKEQIQQEGLIEDLLYDLLMQGGDGSHKGFAMPNVVYAQLGTGTTLPKGVNGAFVPSKNGAGRGTIIIRKGLSPKELRSTMNEEVGEAIGSYAERVLGVSLGEGDVGKRLMLAMLGKNPTAESRPGLFSKKKTDTATVMLNNRKVEARASAEPQLDGRIKVSNPSKITARAETSNKIEVRYLPAEGGEAVTLYRKSAEEPDAEDRVPVRTLDPDFKEDFLDGDIDGTFELWIIDESHPEGGFIASTTAKEIDGQDVSSTSSIVTHSDGSVTISFDEFGDGAISGKNDAGDFNAVGDGDLNDVVLTITPKPVSSVLSVKPQIEETDAEENASGASSSPTSPDSVADEDAEVGPDSEDIAQKPAASETVAGKAPPPISSELPKGATDDSTSAVEPSAEISAAVDPSEVSTLKTDVSFEGADGQVLEYYDPLKLEWVEVGAKAEGAGPTSVTNVEVKRIGENAPQFRLRNTTLNLDIRSDDPAMTRTSQQGSDLVIEFEDRPNEWGKGVFGDDGNDVVVTVKDFDPTAEESDTGSSLSDIVSSLLQGASSSNADLPRISAEDAELVDIQIDLQGGDPRAIDVWDPTDGTWKEAGSIDVEAGSSFRVAVYQAGDTPPPVRLRSLTDDSALIRSDDQEQARTRLQADGNTRVDFENSEDGSEPAFDDGSVTYLGASAQLRPTLTEKDVVESSENADDTDLDTDKLQEFTDALSVDSLGTGEDTQRSVPKVNPNPEDIQFVPISVRRVGQSGVVDPLSVEVKDDVTGDWVEIGTFDSNDSSKDAPEEMVVSVPWSRSAGKTVNGRPTPEFRVTNTNTGITQNSNEVGIVDDDDPSGEFATRTLVQADPLNNSEPVIDGIIFGWKDFPAPAEDTFEASGNITFGSEDALAVEMFDEARGAWVEIARKDETPDDTKAITADYTVGQRENAQPRIRVRNLSEGGKITSLGDIANSRIDLSQPNLVKVVEFSATKDGSLLADGLDASNVMVTIDGRETSEATVPDSNGEITLRAGDGASRKVKVPTGINVTSWIDSEFAHQPSEIEYFKHDTGSWETLASKEDERGGTVTYTDGDRDKIIPFAPENPPRIRIRNPQSGERMEVTFGLNYDGTIASKVSFFRASGSQYNYTKYMNLRSEGVDTAYNTTVPRATPSGRFGLYTDAELEDLLLDEGYTQGEIDQAKENAGDDVSMEALFQILTGNSDMTEAQALGATATAGLALALTTSAIAAPNALIPGTSMFAFSAPVTSIIKTALSSAGSFSSLGVVGGSAGISLLGGAAAAAGPALALAGVLYTYITLITNPDQIVSGAEGGNINSASPASGFSPKDLEDPNQDVQTNVQGDDDGEANSTNDIMKITFEDRWDENPVFGGGGDSFGTVSLDAQLVYDAPEKTENPIVMEDSLDFEYDGSDPLDLTDKEAIIIRRGLNGGDKVDQEDVDALEEAGVINIAGDQWSINQDNVTGSQLFSIVETILDDKGLEPEEREALFEKIGLTNGQRDVIRMVLKDPDAELSDTPLTSDFLNKYHDPSSLFVVQPFEDKLIGLNPDAELVDIPGDPPEGFSEEDAVRPLKMTVNQDGSLTQTGVGEPNELPFVTPPAVLNGVYDGYSPNNEHLGAVIGGRPGYAGVPPEAYITGPNPAGVEDKSLDVTTRSSVEVPGLPDQEVLTQRSSTDIFAPGDLDGPTSAGVTGEHFTEAFIDRIDPVKYVEDKYTQTLAMFQKLMTGDFSKFDQKVFEGMLSANKKYFGTQENDALKQAKKLGYNESEHGTIDDFIAGVASREFRLPTTGGNFSDPQDIQGGFRALQKIQGGLGAKGLALDLQVGFQDFAQNPGATGLDSAFLGHFASHAGSIPRLQMDRAKWINPDLQEVTFSFNLLQHTGARHQYAPSSAGSALSNTARRFLPGGETGPVKTTTIKFSAMFAADGTYRGVGQVKRKDFYGLMTRNTFDMFGGVAKTVGAIVGPDPADGGVRYLDPRNIPAAPAPILGRPSTLADAVVADGARNNPLWQLQDLEGQTGTLVRSKSEQVMHGLRKVGNVANKAVPFLGNQEFLFQTGVGIETDLSAMYEDDKGSFDGYMFSILHEIGVMAMSGAIGATVGAASFNFVNGRRAARLVKNAIGRSGYKVGTRGSAAAVGGISLSQVGQMSFRAQVGETNYRKWTKATYETRVVTNPLAPTLSTFHQAFQDIKTGSAGLLAPPSGVTPTPPMMFEGVPISQLGTPIYKAAAQGGGLLGFNLDAKYRAPDGSILTPWVAKDFVGRSGTQAVTEFARDPRAHGTKVLFPYLNGAKGRFLVNYVPFEVVDDIRVGDRYNSALGGFLAADSPSAPPPPPDAEQREGEPHVEAVTVTDLDPTASSAS